MMKRLTRNKSRILMITMVAIAVIYILSMIPLMVAHADQQDRTQITYHSVRINHGDTLWAIASEHYNREAGDFNDYLSEVRSCNNLKGDTIHAGNYLIVPTYEKADDCESMVPIK